jgi:hypothetical protein
MSDPSVRAHPATAGARSTASARPRNFEARIGLRDTACRRTASEQGTRTGQTHAGTIEARLHAALQSQVELVQSLRVLAQACARMAARKAALRLQQGLLH